MSTPPRNLPRYLPTLTEVIDPATLGLNIDNPDQEQIAQAVMVKVGAIIEQRLHEDTEAIMRALVADQLQLLAINLRKELETVVVKTVSETLAQMLHPHKAK